jgi:HEAT repeat protein
VRAIRQFRDARCVEPLIEAILRNDEEEAILADAILTLAVTGDERAIPALEWAGEHYVAQFSPGFSFRDAAAEAIARIRARWQRTQPPQD